MLVVMPRYARGKWHHVQANINSNLLVAQQEKETPI